jgi:hypothetical protein
MSLLRQKSAEGGRAALAAFGMAAPPQPGLGSVGIKTPSAPSLPGMPKPSVPKMPSIGSMTGGSPGGSTGIDAAKVAFNVGMGASTSTDGAGAQAGEPADTGRRQRSVIDRALQRNDDDYATSSMPLPGDVVSP